MEFHTFRQEAENFEAARSLKQNQKYFARLECQGVVISRQRLIYYSRSLLSLLKTYSSHNNLQKTVNILAITTVMLVIGMAGFGALFFMYVAA